MKNLLWTLLFGCLLIQAGCKAPQQVVGPKVFVIDTIHGRGHVVSATVREDGQFNNSITINGRTQTLSGQVTKKEDKYVVTVDYHSSKADDPGLKQVKSTVTLREGESKTISGLVGIDDNLISVSLSY